VRGVIGGSVFLPTRRIGSWELNRPHRKSGHLLKEAAIKYNLACYLCQTGDFEKAKPYLKKAFKIDSNWRAAALEDEDLKLLWDSL
jgi:hypothetical protein